VLIPVCDNDKHYWVSADEVEKLLSKGEGWLENHAEKDLIIRRYLKNQKSLANRALKMLLSKDEAEAEDEIAARTEVTELTDEEVPVEIVKIHDLRLLAARDVLLKAGAKRVVDLGCGEGRLLKLLLAEKQFDFILGMDVSYRALEIAKARLRIEKLPAMKAERIKLIQGSLTYRDKRIEGFDGAALVEVIEHLDAVRLSALQKTVFEFARPKTVVITTPNADYNVRFEDYETGKMRHPDHRFEWSRKEFEAWGSNLASQYGYEVKFRPVGEIDEKVGALSQMAVFNRRAELIGETEL
jgi:3' terminal RNA ribose 2'-O-methyltransferase Hen1